MSNPLHSLRIRHALFATVCFVGLAAALAGSGALADPHRENGAATQPASAGHYGPLTDEHLAKLVHHLMTKVDENQKGQLMEIARRAKPELEKFEQRAREARAPRRSVLLADIIDRRALERVRAAEMQVAQERSQLVDRLLIEIASVLTPQQRAQLRSELQARAH